MIYDNFRMKGYYVSLMDNIKSKVSFIVSFPNERKIGRTSSQTDLLAVDVGLGRARESERAQGVA